MFSSIKMRYLKFALTFLYLLVLVEISDSHSHRHERNEADVEVEDNNSFIATEEWQEVKEGQAIPPGLHVRMDLSTGGKWAKLMDEENTNTQITKVAAVKNEDISKQEMLEKSSAADNSQAQSYKFEELKAALKKLKAEKINAEEDKKVKSKFRSMEEIKEAFEQFNLHEESDVEVMKRLVSVLRNTTASVNEKHFALQDLEYYVHQIDNANDLVAFGGFAVVVQVLNGTDLLLKEEAAHVIGSAMQSNPKVQIEALRTGVLKTLLITLASVDRPMPLRKKCMYAVSTLVRHFPLAQIFFAQYGGFQIMLHLFNQNDVEPLQFKALQLIYDLINERVTTLKDIHDPQQKEKLKQYNKVNLGKLIKELGWCRVISASLHHQQHGKRETVMRTMKVSYHFCRTDFQQENVTNNIKKFKAEYKKLSDDDVRNGDVDSYFTMLHQLSSDLLLLTRSRVKDEF